MAYKNSVFYGRLGDQFIYVLKSSVAHSDYTITFFNAYNMSGYANFIDFIPNTHDDILFVSISDQSIEKRLKDSYDGIVLSTKQDIDTFYQFYKLLIM